MRLVVQALGKYLAGLLVILLLLFGAAGTWDYWQGWLLIGVLFGPMLLLGAALEIWAPDLLRKRLNGREPQHGQRCVVALSGLMFVAGFAAAGLDFRFGWTHVPVWLVWTAAAMQLLAYALYAEVMRENAYLSRTVEVQPGQRLIDTGLYGVVRHPMYAATLLLFLAMPLVLGSWVALAIFLAYPAILVRRIAGEERVLREELVEYADPYSG